MINLQSSIILLGLVIIDSLLVGLGRCAVNWNETNTAVACDFIGNDFLHAQIPLAQCRQQCYQIQDCTHFTWTSYPSGTCWMKKGQVSQSDAQSTMDQDTVCGIINRNEKHLPLRNVANTTAINWNGSNWARGCDFNNNDLYNYQTSAENCSDLCLKIDGCTHFAWTLIDNGICWMKKGNVSQSDAFPTGNDTMICGIVNVTQKESRISTDKGTTAAYWDCCKSACNKSIVTNDIPLSKGCDRDGVTFLDGNTIVGCNNRTTYTCNNRNPWNVSSSLSYGFAAATIVVCMFSDIMIN